MVLRDFFLRHVAQTSPSPLAMEIVKADGCWLTDSSGKQYLDLISGISVSNLGHGNPAIIAAIKKQADDYLHLMVYGEMVQSPQVLLAKRLAELLPSTLSCTYFVNSGAEAVEGALKLARRYTGRSELVTFRNAYHGSTTGALSVCGNEELKNAFRPLIPDVRILNYNNFDDLQQITNRTCCVIVEPVQAEAGVILPKEGFLKAIRQRCNETGALLIFDEIQTAMGRTGTLFAFTPHPLPEKIGMYQKGEKSSRLTPRPLPEKIGMFQNGEKSSRLTPRPLKGEKSSRSVKWERAKSPLGDLGVNGDLGVEHEEVIPDILLLAKAFGGGMPLGAFISSPEIMSVLTHHPVLGHITTFGGHPVCCAAALAALAEITAPPSYPPPPSRKNRDVPKGGEEQPPYPPPPKGGEEQPLRQMGAPEVPFRGFRGEQRFRGDLLSSILKKEKLFRQQLKNKSIKEIRGKGLLLALQFESEAVAKKIINSCIANGVLVDWFLFAPDCMRIAPPLIISEEEIERACEIINKINC